MEIHVAEEEDISDEFISTCFYICLWPPHLFVLQCCYSPTCQSGRITGLREHSAISRPTPKTQSRHLWTTIPFTLTDLALFIFTNVKRTCAYTVCSITLYRRVWSVILNVYTQLKTNVWMLHSSFSHVYSSCWMSSCKGGISEKLKIK